MSPCWFSSLEFQALAFLIPGSWNCKGKRLEFLFTPTFLQLISQITQFISHFLPHFPCFITGLSGAPLWKNFGKLKACFLLVNN
jgi:hypothetical protein